MEWGWGDHTASAHLCVFVPFRFPLSLTFRRARNSFDYHDVTSGTPHLTPAAFSMEFPLVWSLWFNWWWRIPQMARSTMWLRTSVVPLSTSGSPQYHFSGATHTGWPCQLAMRPPEVASCLQTPANKNKDTCNTYQSSLWYSIVYLVSVCKSLFCSDTFKTLPPPWSVGGCHRSHNERWANNGHCIYQSLRTLCAERGKFFKENDFLRAPQILWCDCVLLVVASDTMSLAMSTTQILVWVTASVIGGLGKILWNSSVS